MDKAPSTTRSRGLEAQQDVLIDRVVGAHPVETALQFAGVPTAYLSAVRAHPIAELGHAERRRGNVEPLLH